MTERLDANGPQDSRPKGWEDARWQESSQSARAHATPGEPALERFLGGTPLAVMVRLIVISLIVGALLMWLDIHPADIFRSVERFFYDIWMQGFDAVREVLAYILAGAVIVLPIWFVLRLLNFRK
jgi:hypothetical protein